MKNKFSLIFIYILVLIVGCKKENPTEPQNTPPGIPSNPVPNSGEIDQMINTQLSWSVLDSENDSLLYSVYFGMNESPNLLKDSIKMNIFNPGLLQPYTTYYWKIIASDGELESEGEVWKFLTGAAQSNFETVLVPSGEFTYGKSNTPTMIEYNFEIMKFEVTNKEFVDFLNEANLNGYISVIDNQVTGNYSGDIFWSEGEYLLYDLDATSLGYNIGVISWDGKNFSIAPDYNNHPVIYVTWFGANAFSEYYGYRLPNEHEWEKSTRGNTGYWYPWGNSIYGADANFWNSNDPWERGTTPVGFYNGENSTNDRPSPYGAYDNVGNVWEWNEDFWDSTTNYHVLRGGGWNINGTNYYLRTYTRDLASPDVSTHYIGFRCVRDK